MEPASYNEVSTLFHEDLLRRIEELAIRNGESMESCVESIVRERFGFQGPKHPIYRRDKAKPRE